MKYLNVTTTKCNTIYSILDADSKKLSEELREKEKEIERMRGKKHMEK
jgi:hypothetical protein